ncbi:MAG TPA: class I SAM-dependent methyltransferase [Actinomycetales bacterium]|nr:class I SAM-dependent methyltransferase [Actinomycetales bacterium]
MDDEGGGAGYRGVDARTTARANRRWWDAEAAGYQAEHGRFLGDASLTWGPEGLREHDAGLLGNLAGLDVLEVGCGAAQGSRWVASVGGRAVGVDLSAAMLASARSLRAGTAVPLVQADAEALPFADRSFDVAFSAYGALQFVADGAGVMAEVARVLRPGGRWVFSLTHPVRWCFPDDPGPAGLRVGFSYFDRTPYAETGAEGAVTYAEHHRTVGDRVRELVAAGFLLEDLVEPEWPDGNAETWGGWSPERGRLLPGTAIFCCGLG